MRCWGRETMPAAGPAGGSCFVAAPSFSVSCSQSSWPLHAESTRLHDSHAAASALGEHIVPDRIRAEGIGKVAFGILQVKGHELPDACEGRRIRGKPPFCCSRLVSGRFYAWTLTSYPSPVGRPARTAASLPSNSG